MASETNKEDKMVEKEENEEEKEENGDNNPSLGPNTSFLGELNLILILSFFSLSSEECLSFEEIKEESIKEHEAEDIISRSHTRKREVNEFRVVESRTQRFQTRIRDFRHCRRM